MQLGFQRCSSIHLKELIKISRKTFIDAFEAVNEPEDFKAYIDFAFDRQKLSKELNDPNTFFYFAYHSNELVGYFKMNENESQTDIKLAEGIEIERIYVLERFQGMTIGQSMLDQIKQMAVAMNKAYLWLGVWEKNSKAITFYEKQGFSKFDMHPYYIGKDRQIDWLMRFEL